MDGNGWKWMKVDNMNDSGKNGWKWIKVEKYQNYEKCQK